MRSLTTTRRTATGLVAFVAITVLTVACNGEDPEPVEEVDEAEATARSCEAMVEADWDDAETVEEDLLAIDLREGEGEPADDGDDVVVHYTGCLTDGTLFDTSHDRREAFRFVLGTGQVIRGWDVGVRGMRPGGIRLLRIPSEMAYGEEGAADVIPPGATLLFGVEMVAEDPADPGMEGGRR